MEELKQAIKDSNFILFIGAGVSMNLGLPSWSDLIKRIAEELDYDEDVFNTFGDYLELSEYYKIKMGNIGSLRSWMDREWHPSSIDISKSKVHELIVKLNSPIIYTTNYDRWIEKAYAYYEKEYRKIHKVSDLVNLDVKKTQIVKFHGDFNDNIPLVLTETSYFERLNFESFLDIKFRSDILGKSILFIGYSLRDINLRILFYKLSEMWNKTPNAQNRPKSYIFLDKPNPVREAVLKKRGIKAFISKTDDVSDGLVKFLESLVQTI